MTASVNTAVGSVVLVAIGKLLCWGNRVGGAVPDSIDSGCLICQADRDRRARGDRSGRLGNVATRGSSRPAGIDRALRALGARPPRRRSVEGCGDHGALPRRGRAHGARHLHRRGGGRHPQPGSRHRGRPRRPRPRCAGGSSTTPSASSGTTSCTCSGTATRACPTPRPTPTPTTSPTPTSTKPSGGWWRSSRRERPQVIVSYALDRVYAHPDHVRVHEISVLAFERAGDPDWYPELGAPWQPLKLYYSERLHPRAHHAPARLVRGAGRGEPVRQVGRAHGRARRRRGRGRRARRPRWKR